MGKFLFLYIFILKFMKLQIILSCQNYVIIKNICNYQKLRNYQKYLQEANKT